MTAKQGVQEAKKEAEEVITRKYHQGTGVNERERRRQKKTPRTTKTGRESVAPGEHLTTPKVAINIQITLRVPPTPSTAPESVDTSANML